MLSSERAGRYCRKAGGEQLYYIPADAAVTLTGHSGWQITADRICEVTFAGGESHPADQIRHAAAADAYTAGVHGEFYLTYLGTLPGLLCGAAAAGE